MLDAIAAVERECPGTLESHPRVKFQLQCQQFVEMVGFSPLLTKVIDAFVQTSLSRHVFAVFSEPHKT